MQLSCSKFVTLSKMKKNSCLIKTLYTDYNYRSKKKRHCGEENALGPTHFQNPTVHHTPKNLGKKPKCTQYTPHLCSYPRGMKKDGKLNDATIDEMMRPQAAIAWTHFFHVLYITCAACCIIHVDRLTRHSCGSAGYEYSSLSSYSLSLKPVREMLLSTWCHSRNRALGTFRA